MYLIRNDYSSKGSSLGMTITSGAVSGVDANFTKVKDEGTTETTPYTGTTVTASDQLTMQSGNDTTITGSQVSGKTVKVVVGGKDVKERRRLSGLFTIQNTTEPI